MNETSPKPDLNTADVRDTTYDEPLPVYYEAVCSYCRQPDAAWTREALRCGWRMTSIAKEYHCYSAYCD